MSEPKRHHFVAEWHLRLFANGRDQIRIYKRGGGPSFTTSVTNAAVEAGFYTLTLQSGEKSQAAEKEMLSLIDGDGARAVEGILNGDFPPGDERRSALALFLGFQIVRTRYHRHQYEAVADYLKKREMENWTPEYVRQRLKEAGAEATDSTVADVMHVVKSLDDYQIVPEQSASIITATRIAEEKLAPMIFHRSWMLARCEKPLLITSDHPIVYHRNHTQENWLRGLGLGTADEVWYPLDRSHLLVMGQPGVLPERIRTIPESLAYRVNQAIAAWSYEWVFQHPDGAAIDELIPDTPRGLVNVNDRVLFR